MREPRRTRGRRWRALAVGGLVGCALARAFAVDEVTTFVVGAAEVPDAQDG